MPQKLIPILLFLSIFLGIFAWETVKIDEQVSIAFPEKPQKTLIEGRQAWIANVDSAARVMIMITDFGKMGIDAKSLAELLKKKKTYEDFKNGVLLSSGGTALKDSIATFKAKPAYFLKVDMKSGKENLNLSHTLNVFVGTKMYSLMFLEKYETKHDAERLKFWNSLKIQ